MKLLGFPNLIARNFCTASAPSAALLVPAGFESSYLKTEEPSDLARLATYDPLYTQWIFDFNGVASDVEGLALINCNLSPSSYYRFSGSRDAGATNPPVAQAPNALAVLANITGGVTNVDEAIYAPDGLYIGPTTLTDSWSGRFSWGPLAHTPLAGAAMAQFVVRIQLFGNGAGLTAPIEYPMFSASLTEGGSMILFLGSRAVTETGSQVMIFPFDPSLLADDTGANIEMEFSCSSGQSASGNTYAKLESAALYYEWTLPGVDTLWIPSPLSVFGEDNDGLQPTKNVHYFPDDTASWEDMLSLYVRILDDGCVKDPHNMAPTATGVPIGLIPRRPDGFVQAGVFCAGGVIAPAVGLRDTYPLVKPVTEGVPGVTLGGQTFGADEFRRRQTEMVDFYVTRSEAMEILDRVAWRKGTSGAFYVALEPGIDASFQTFTSFWATMKDLSQPQKHGVYDATGAMRFVMGMSFDEKL